MAGFIASPRWSRDRAIAAMAAIAVQALLGWVLIAGLTVHFTQAVDEGLKLFAPDRPPPPPKVRIEPPPRHARRAEGAAAPANLHSRATAIVAPVSLVIPPPLPTIVAAPIPAEASDAMSGASDRRGPGTGAGGIGDGFGSGGAGDGDGGGWRDETPPRFLRGRMSMSDLPRELIDNGFDGSVGVRYDVAIDGRVSACSVTHSSGNQTIDATTCRLIRERFRFKPSRDGQGHPVASVIVENHRWTIAPPPPDPAR